MLSDLGHPGERRGTHEKLGNVSENALERGTFQGNFVSHLQREKQSQEYETNERESKHSHSQLLSCVSRSLWTIDRRVASHG